MEQEERMLTPTDTGIYW